MSPFTAYTLDNYCAPNLSRVTACGVPEIDPPKVWLTTFILNDALSGVISRKPAAFVLNFLRRVDASIVFYSDARNELTAYISHLNRPQTVISPFFRALISFEVCISQCYQAFELLWTLHMKEVYQKRSRGFSYVKVDTIERILCLDGKLAQLGKLYVDSKHMDRMIDGDQFPRKATTAIWITNDSLRSKSAALSFVELRDTLKTLAELADRIALLDLNLPQAP